MEQRSPYGDGGNAAPIETVSRTCKALGDASRLQLLALLAHGERPAGVLARAVGLTPATVSHHLARLAQVGLVTQRKAGTTRYYALEETQLATLAAERLTPAGLRALVPIPLTESLSGKPALPGANPSCATTPAEANTAIPWSAKEREVLTAFIDGGAIRAVPVSRKNRLVVLRWALAQLPARAYSRTELETALAPLTRDPAALRRHLEAEGLVVNGPAGYQVPPVSQ